VLFIEEHDPLVVIGVVILRKSMPAAARPDTTLDGKELIWWETLTLTMEQSVGGDSSLGLDGRLDSNKSSYVAVADAG
jgi:hypothetical protein